MTAALREWIRTSTDVRREEYLPAGLMFVYGFLIFTSYYIAKSVRNATFVQRVGADNLDIVYILTAVFVTLVMVLYSRWVDRFRQTTLLRGTFAAMIACLLVFWQLLESGSGVLVSGAFYLFVKLYGLLLVSQFWLVGNVLFTTSQAKRLFGPVGLGLILGAIAGGAVTDRAVATVGSEDLLLAAAIVLAVGAGAVALLEPRIRQGERASGRLMEDISAGALKLLRDSSHLRTIAWILGLTILASTLVDWEINKAVELFVPGEDAKTAFWGRFFVVQNVASVLVQLLLTGWVLRKLGVGVALLVLPLGLAAATVGVVAVPALLTAALAKGTEGALRYSMDQSTRELLWMPVPTEVKFKVKPLVDLAVYRGGTGVAGILLLVLTDVLGLGLRGVGLACVGVIAVWTGFSFRMRDEFRSSIKRLIGVRDVDLDELIVRRLDARTLEELRRALREGDEEEVLFALSLLEHAASSELADDFGRLLDHPSDRVRARAVALLHQVGAGDRVGEIEPLLDDPDVHVRAEAIHYVCDYGAVPGEERMRQFLEETGEEVRVAAVACLLRHGEGQRFDRGLEAARRMADAPDPDLRRDAARALEEVDRERPATTELLEGLLSDGRAEVRHAAIRAAGRSGNCAVVGALVGRLGEPDDRRAARAALRGYGARVHDQILERIADPELDRAVRVQLPDLLVTGARQEDVDRMVELLARVTSSTVRYHLARALARLHRDRDDLDFERYELGPLVRREVEEGYRHALLRHDLGQGAGTAHGLLCRTLEQRRFEAGERALRILGLRYPQEDLYAAYTALRARDPVTQQRGFELLDSLLPRRYRDLLDPLLNPDEPEARRAEAARRRFDLPPGTREEALDRLAETGDFWLAGLARLAGDGLPAPPDAAAEALRRRLRSDTVLGDRPFTPEEDVEIMEIVERAAFLQRSDIFETLRTEDLAAIAALADERSFEEGDVVFREGTTGGALFLVVEGELEAVRDGRRLFRARPGETVGDLALLDGLPTHYEARAVADTRVLRLAREEFLELMEERFRVARQVMAHLAGIIRDASGEEGG